MRFDRFHDFRLAVSDANLSQWFTFSLFMTRAIARNLVQPICLTPPEVTPELDDGVVGRIKANAVLRLMAVLCSTHSPSVLKGSYPWTAE